MFIASDIGNRVAAAVAALAISAVFFATAIVPATPGLGMLA
jgi:hypothetical protein